MIKQYFFALLFFGSFISVSFAQTDFEIANKEYDENNFVRAILYFSKSIDNKQDVQKSYLYRGMSNLFMENVERAKKDLDAAFEMDSTEVKVYVFYAKYYMATNQFSEALKNFDIALKMDPKQYDIYDERAGVKSYLNMYESALKDSEIAIKNAPNYKSYLNSGFLKMQMGNYKDAIDDFDKSLQFKESHKAYGNRGNTYLMMGKYELALKDLNRALEYNYDDPFVLYYLGKTYEGLKSKEKACENYSKSSSLGNSQASEAMTKLGCN